MPNPLNLASLIVLVDRLIGGTIGFFASIANRLSGHAPEAVVVVEEMDPAKKQKRRIMALASVVVIGGSMTSIFLTECERAPSIPMEPHRALGKVLARETSKLLEGKGTIVAVRLDTKGASKPAEAEYDAFLDEMEASPGITIEPPEMIPMGQRMMIGPGMGISSAVLASVLEKHPKATAIVSFMGGPQLTDEEADQYAGKLPKMIIVCHMPQGVKRLFERQLVQLAITRSLSRRPRENVNANPQTPDEWFKQQYEVVNVDNAASMPF